MHVEVQSASGAPMFTLVCKVDLHMIRSLQCGIDSVEVFGSSNRQ